MVARNSIISAFNVNVESNVSVSIRPHHVWITAIRRILKDALFMYASRWCHFSVLVQQHPHYLGMLVLDRKV